MGLFGSDRLRSLLSDICQTFASNLLWEFDLFNDRLVSANGGFECMGGICDAIYVFKMILLSLCDSLNCEAIDGEVLEC